MPANAAAKVALVVDLESSSVLAYHDLDESKKKEVQDLIHAKLWGTKLAEFKKLMTNEWQIDVKLKAASGRPDIDDAHGQVQKAIAQYNGKGFPLKFKEDLNFSPFAFLGGKLSQTGGGEPENGNEITCIKEEYRDGEWVIVYNYDLDPDDDGGDATQAVGKSEGTSVSSGDSSSQVILTVGGTTLKGKYQLNLHCQLPLDADE